MIFLKWWEKEAITAVVRKNLIAHRLRNRKTSILYASSLAVIIFIAVTLQLQIVSFKFGQQQVRPRARGACVAMCDDGSAFAMCVCDV